MKLEYCDVEATEPGIIGIETFLANPDQPHCFQPDVRVNTASKARQEWRRFATGETPHGSFALVKFGDDGNRHHFEKFCRVNGCVQKMIAAAA